MKTIIQECQHLLSDYASILKRHLYLRERLISIQAKILNASPESHEAIVKQERDNLDATRQRIQELQNDLWQDQLFSAASNEQQEKEIKRLMQNWGKSSYDSVAHCIVDHANRHGFANNKLRYLRKAANFNKKRAKKAYPDPGAVRWNKGNNEYLIERDGKIVSYCLNC